MDRMRRELEAARLSGFYVYQTVLEGLRSSTGFNEDERTFLLDRVERNPPPNYRVRPIKLAGYKEKIRRRKMRIESEVEDDEEEPVVEGDELDAEGDEEVVGAIGEPPAAGFIPAAHLFNDPLPVWLMTEREHLAHEALLSGQPVAGPSGTRRDSPSRSLAEMDQDPDAGEDESSAVIAKAKEKEKKPEPEMRAVVYPPRVKTEEPAANLEHPVVPMEVDEPVAPVENPVPPPEVPVKDPATQQVGPDAPVKVEEVPATIVMVLNTGSKVEDGKVVDRDGKEVADAEIIEIDD